MLWEKNLKSYVLKKKKKKIKAQIYRDQNRLPMVTFSKTYGTDQLYSLSLKVLISQSLKYFQVSVSYSLLLLLLLFV